jgi:hypothetical protein|uniref:Uncharacterized protein n=1 Tax=Siphoviridae sp. ct8Hx23 TaxID=2825360 RepID=A0A8S5P8B8_9CAUD|nr:MAG TPA: hypothetical protein [Siphoviridae sp. ct8Hx23]
MAESYRIIALPDGSEAEVPADITDAEISAIQKKYQPAAPRRASVPQMTWTDALLNGMRNLPASGMNVLADTADAFLHPVDTAKAFGKTVGGYAAKLIPGRQKWEDNADAMTQFFRDRYGSVENLKRTIATDPAGLLADASTALTGGAGALRGLARGAGTATRAGSALSRAAGAANSLAAATDPVSVLAKAGEFATQKAYGLSLPEKLYQSALSINTGFSNNSKARYSPGEVKNMLAASLRERIPVTWSGAGKAQNEISALSDALRESEDAAAKAGYKLDTDKILEKVQSSPHREDLAENATPLKDLNNYDDAVTEWYVTHGDDNRDIAKAQATKQAVYRNFEKRYQNNASPSTNGNIEANKAIAHELRNGIADTLEQAVADGKIAPLSGGRSVHELNAREGALIDLRDNIERSALKNGNKGLVDLLFAAGVATATGDPNLGLMAGAGKQLLASPGVRSRMAFLADANARRNGAPARGLLGLMYQGEGAWADDERLKSRRGR